MQKVIQIEELPEPVLLVRRKGSKNIRITLRADGKIRLNIPYGVPTIMAKKFLLSKVDWIKKHHTPRNLIGDGDHIGKNHRVIISLHPNNKLITRVTDTEIIIKLADLELVNSPEIQSRIRKACIKAIQNEARQHLPARLDYWSDRLGITYRSVKIKTLKSRWGSCDQHNNIVLSCFLIQLDLSLIDYVICHELAHTKFHNHQSEFWTLVSKLYPQYKLTRSELKKIRTDIILTKY